MTAAEDGYPETNHTPGPWALCEDDGTIRARAFGESDQMADYRGNIVCDLSPALGAWPTRGRKHAEPETRANAALIAAAPDLLATVKILHSILIQFENYKKDKWCKMAEGAIAKLTILHITELP